MSTREHLLILVTDNLQASDGLLVKAKASAKSARMALRELAQTEKKEKESEEFYSLSSVVEDLESWIEDSRKGVQDILERYWAGIEKVEEL